MSKDDYVSMQEYYRAVDDEETFYQAFGEDSIQIQEENLSSQFELDQQEEERRRQSSSCPDNYTNQRGKTNKSNKKKKKKTHQHSLEYLTQRVSELMEMMNQQGIAIPLPDSTSHKTWSNRNYGGDKKRQRKQAEREFLVARIQQLENSCLSPPHQHQDCDFSDD